MTIPTLLYGRAVVTTSNTNITNLQRIENRVWRYLLGIGGYSTVEALRGEIGSSMVKSRIMETSLSYIIDVMTGNFTDIKEMMSDTIKMQRGKWYNSVNGYREELDIQWKDLLTMDKKCLKNIIRKYDTTKWKEGLGLKETMRIYDSEKGRIGYELCYNNSIGSKLYARARINALQLEEHRGRGKNFYDSTCKLCEVEKEDIVHFIAKCKVLENKRDYSILNKDIMDPEERTKDLLYRNKNHNDIGIMIRTMYEARKKAMEAICPQLVHPNKGDKEPSCSQPICPRTDVKSPNAHPTLDLVQV